MGEHILKYSDIDPLLEGLAVMGTGGGGNPAWGKAILEKEFSENREIVLIDPEDVPDDAFIVSGGLMGSVKTLESMSIDDLLEKWDKKFELVEAAKIMEKYQNKKINFVVPFEVGGLNTPVIMAMAARMGIKTVNGDALGRSAPETQMTSFLAHGVSLTPMPLVESEGNTILVTQQIRSTFADEVGRFMVSRGYGLGANNHYPMNGSTLKKSVIPKTITTAIRIGRNMLEARAGRESPVEAVVKSISGFKLFKGKVVKVQGEDRGGFYLTNVVLKGSDRYENKDARMVIKNETMLLWVEQELKAIFPDLICLLDPANGKGIMSVDIIEGKELWLVGVPCHKRLREGIINNQEALKAFSGERFGYPEIKYIPIEDLNHFS